MAPGVRSSLGRSKAGSCGCPVGTQQRPDTGVNAERADEATVLGTFWNRLWLVLRWPISYIVGLFLLAGLQHQQLIGLPWLAL